MNAAKFYVIEIVNKLSRLLMLLLAGTILGAVLVFAYAYYNIFHLKIGVFLILIAIYCMLFISYVLVTDSKRAVTKIEVFKDRLAFLFEKKNEISVRDEVLFSDIKEYKISPLSDKKNLAKEVPDKNKYSLRVYGFQTQVTLNDGRVIKFSDSSLDGVLIYSPAYVYRMIDVKRLHPSFPLVLENFDSKKDSENFELQFKYYEENAKVLPLFKNKEYLKCLVGYSFAFFIIAACVASLIACIYYIGLKSPQGALKLLYITVGILAIIIVPMFAVAGANSFFSGIFNKSARDVIGKVISE